MCKKVFSNLSFGVLCLGIVASISGCSSTEKAPVKKKEPEVVKIAEPVNKVEAKVEPKVEEKVIDVIGEFNKFAINNPVYFAFDSDRVDADDFEDVYGDKLKDLNKLPIINLTVNGYCDPRGSIEYNNILGKKRALAVSKLVKKFASNKVKVNIVSFGKNKYKKYSNNLEDSYRKNRKVEIVASK